MEQHGSKACALIFALCAFIVVFAAEAEGDVILNVPKAGQCPRRLDVVPSKKGCLYDQECPDDHKCCVFDFGAACVAPASTKPGVCPNKNGGVGLCVEFCSNDSDCPNNEKCCSNGCGHQCTAPYTVNDPKPGQCPRRLDVIPSKKGCLYDQECPNDHKCCVFDCGAACVPPASTKPGVCPTKNWGVGLCVEFCSNDSDCPNNEKCCSNGCGHQCIAPYTVKPGRCARPKGIQVCAEFCFHDGQCPGEQKCCKTSCGHACSEPC